MSSVAPLLNGAVVVSAAASLVLAPRVLRAEPRPPGRTGRPGGIGPEAVLAAVVALVFLNQVLSAVYVNRVHGGDASFVARYLPPGWFDVPRLGSLADRFPAPELLAPSVLRVQAFLELPLVLLAFVSVVRRLDRDLYVRLAGSPLIPLAAASYTVAFCAIEWDLRNPYTVDDLVLRVLSAVVTPPLIAWPARREPVADRPARGNPFLFALDLWAYGQLMLVLYDTVLLYNLARLGSHVLPAAAASAVLAATHLLRRSATSPTGPYLTTLTATIGRALALFLVPALAIRYAQTFATPRLAALAGLVVLGAAARRDTVRLLLPAVAGAAVGCVVAALLPGPYYEATLLRSATGALLAATAVCALLDTTRARLVVRS
ncbi:hypothetical protein GCM10018790_39600 [Kitasatospora xanthocidica]|uniref:hypothetical protein n=1 Tax=Kitasatospora xanthocidica TaxID=83382 RepID=UPI00167B8467|nr:hypothetical protein [Kitasatospora xanthocidica]GHF57882.1 hypothetical protein GCM10018790_39600 [Kitasatospora xanthocidica]